MPSLNENDQVLLESCMDEIRNVVGDTISEKHLVETIMKHNFDCAKALDVILNNSMDASTTAAAAAAATSSSVSTTTATQSQSALPMETGNHKMFDNLFRIFFLFRFPNRLVYFHKSKTFDYIILLFLLRLFSRIFGSQFDVDVVHHTLWLYSGNVQSKISAKVRLKTIITYRFIEAA